MGGKRTVLEAIIGLGRKPDTYKAFGSSGKRARRIRDMIKARRKSPMVYGLPAMSPTQIREVYRAKGLSHRDALDETLKFSMYPPHLSATGGHPAKRASLLVPTKAREELIDLSKAGFGGVYYPKRSPAHPFPHASVRGLPGSGLGRHESYHLIARQTADDPSLAKSMPLTMRLHQALQSDRVPGVGNLIGHLLEEGGARLSEVPRGGARPFSYRNSRVNTVGGRPVRDRGGRLAESLGLRGGGGWPEKYGEQWLEHYTDPLRVSPEQARKARLAHKVVMPVAEHGAAAAGLGVGAAAGLGVGAAAGLGVRELKDLLRDDPRLVGDRE